MRDDFAAFIITHKRPHNQLTYKALIEGGYTGKLFFIVDDEDDTIPEYKATYGEENIKIFHKQEDFDLGDNLAGHKSFPVFARNACFRIAKENNINYFVQLDDDYKNIAFRCEINGKLRKRPIKRYDDLFEAVCRFMENTPTTCIAFAVEGDYIGGLKGKFKKGLLRIARNSFFCKTDREFNFYGRAYEDATTPAYLGTTGKLFFTYMGVMVTRYDHEKNAGGSTEAYREVGTYWCSSYTHLYCPGGVKMIYKGHEWFPYQSREALSPKIMNERWRKGNEG